ncbi:LuxR C-terminal-related transcriptional regulator [Methylobacterium brachiatum]|uniref:DNA-binding NarL/FixJ family response regulator n=1 Tax=Methylobacterium brachiatum TaxID=269660 RepID=A0AAJ1TTX8_9HYPH|nr:LuxR C-terminal-related transcriptional regulator [Methylobacterium brachiatum]AYO81600.1 hypothetical protein EBB05_04475 [Methylobacterium brachiatum]MCB4802675.1 LuxR C-terminal-related transcriptional regulator [Methylobacterium brachiatum]MDQ0543302.1 DNA-binding NarL/FixJ family response regulator [Methylobacterium brachiatum]
MMGPATTGVPNLTAVEVAVLRRAVGGLAEKEIATELGLCRQSVGRHLRRIRNKAGITTLQSRRPLVLLARRLGLEPT